MTQQPLAYDAMSGRHGCRSDDVALQRTLLAFSSTDVLSPAVDRVAIPFHASRSQARVTEDWRRVCRYCTTLPHQGRPAARSAAHKKIIGRRQTGVKRFPVLCENPAERVSPGNWPIGAVGGRVRLRNLSPGGRRRSPISNPLNGARRSGKLTPWTSCRPRLPSSFCCSLAGQSTTAGGH